MKPITVFTALLLAVGLQGCLTDLADRGDYEGALVGFASNGDNSTGFTLNEAQANSTTVTVSMTWTRPLAADGVITLRLDSNLTDNIQFGNLRVNYPALRRTDNLGPVSQSPFNASEVVLNVPMGTNEETGNPVAPDELTFTISASGDEVFTGDRENRLTIVEVSGGFDGAVNPEYVLRIIEDDIPESIAGLRSLWNPEEPTTTIPEGFTFTGVVTSDPSTSNLSSGAFFVQDLGTYDPARPALLNPAGISVFNGEVAVELGDLIQFTASEAAFLEEFNELMQLDDAAASFVLLDVNQPLPAPREVTIEEINEVDPESGFSVLQGLHVVLRNVRFSAGGSGSYGGTVGIEDDLGNRTQTFIRNDATFNGAPLPAGSVDIVGVVAQFRDTPQIYLRTPDDVTVN